MNGQFDCSCRVLQFPHLEVGIDIIGIQENADHRGLGNELNAASVINNRQADPQTAGDGEPAKQCTGRGITEQVS